MTVANGDVAPVTPTHDPRAQLVTPAFVQPGDETWWHTRFYLPASFPSDIPGWVSIARGPLRRRPMTARRPVSISVDDSEIRFQRNEHLRMRHPLAAADRTGAAGSTSSSTRAFGRDGFVELWIDGEQVTFFEDSPHNPLDEAPDPAPRACRRWTTPTTAAPTSSSSRTTAKADMFNSLTVYHGRDRGRHHAGIGRRLTRRGRRGSGDRRPRAEGEPLREAGRAGSPGPSRAGRSRAPETASSAIAAPGGRRAGRPAIASAAGGIARPRARSAGGQHPVPEVRRRQARRSAGSDG